MQVFSGSLINSLWLLGPSGSGNPLAIVGPGGDILGPTEERESVAATQASNEQQVNILINNCLVTSQQNILIEKNW